MSKFRFRWCLIFFFGAVQAALATPDSIYINGKVITLDDEFSIVEGLAITNERITATGTSEAMLGLTGPSTEVVDLQERTVIPGLIDNHNHFVRGAQHWGQLVRFDGATSKAEALALLEQKAAELAALESDYWLIALGGWNEEQFSDAEPRFTLSELDALAPDRPVFLQAQYDHAFVNSAFLEYFDIDPSAAAAESAVASEEFDISALSDFGDDAAEESAAPSHVLAPFVERDQEGRATGYLGGGMGMVVPVTSTLPALSETELLEGLRQAQAYYNALGLTSVYDPAGGLITEEAYRSVETLHAAGELSIRVFRTRQFMLTSAEDAEQAARQFADLPPMLSGDHFYDTLAIGEAFYIPVQMSDGLDGHGPIGEEHEAPVRKLLKSVLKRGLAAQIHAVRDDAIEFHLDIIEPLAERYTLFPGQVSFTHAELVTPEQLVRIQNLGIALQLRSMSAVRARDALIESYGEVATQVPRLRLVQDSGVNWGIGTDGSKAAQINPLVSLEWMVTGRGLNGDQVLDEAQLLTREEALIAHTKNNAQMIFRGNVFGQIRPGFLADLVVLDGDYLEIDADQIGEMRVLRTVVGGSVVHDLGEL